jgi:tRNA-splicing ligase RtcB (3'-phosphate/5'-hydroxy nucleic acid ligase)
MLCVEIKKADVDFAKLDAAVQTLVPSGQYIGHIDLEKVLANFSKEAAALSLGTLGGGNHFIGATRNSFIQ